jgi:hypothetical protein
VKERETTANDLAEALHEAIVGLDMWRKDKNYRLNNTEIVLAIDQVSLIFQILEKSPNLGKF